MKTTPSASEHTERHGVITAGDVIPRARRQALQPCPRRDAAHVAGGRLPGRFGLATTIAGVWRGDAPDRIPAGGTRRSIWAANEDAAGDTGPPAGEVRSADRTATRYQSVGTGPAVILLHGAGQSSENLMRLAAAFTVHVPDRRGRGRSRPYGEFDGLTTEIEDLSALLDTSGASRLFGLSAGAVIAIETALVRPDITKLALYEPGRVSHPCRSPRGRAW